MKANTFPFDFLFYDFRNHRAFSSILNPHKRLLFVFGQFCWASFERYIIIFSRESPIP